MLKAQNAVLKQWNSFKILRKTRKYKIDLSRFI